MTRHVELAMHANPVGRRRGAGIVSNGFTCFLGVLLFASLTMPGLGQAGDRNEYDTSDEALRRHYLLQRLKLRHSAEVFDYCVSRFTLNIGRLPGCMLRQEKIRSNILRRAQEQLGLRSLAESLYFECRDLYPDQSISRSGDCVEAKLILRERLDEADVEAEIYRRCDRKWRRHGARAVKNCVIHGANFYLDKGELRD